MMFWKKLFSRRGSGDEDNGVTVCLLMDRNSRFLARGELSGPIDAPNLQIKIIEGLADDVVTAEIIQVIPKDQKMLIQLGRVIYRRGNAVVLEPMRELGSRVRQNLRMPVDFESFAYPLTGGRAQIKSVDLSCGGIAFHASHAFEPREIFEIVIPITEEGPLLLTCELLRSAPNGESSTFYAARFIDLLPEEEAMVREAVFNVQLDTVNKKTAKNIKTNARK